MSADLKKTAYEHLHRCWKDFNKIQHQLFFLKNAHTPTGHLWFTYATLGRLKSGSSLFEASLGK
jgi:hypothetical protein